MSRQIVIDTNGIGRRIRELREKKRLTQKELGQLIGCAQNTVAEWEKRPGRAPGKKFLGYVAEVLEVSVEHLLGIEKIEKPKIPCYGEVLSKKFLWSSTNKPLYHIEIPQSEYFLGRFSFLILDNLLEPVIFKGDYGIFEKSSPSNGDIVAVRFPEKQSWGKIGMWRQEGKSAVLLETNIEEINIPYFFEIISGPDINITYKIRKNSAKHLIVEGKLVAVRRGIKAVKGYSRVNYIFF